MAVDRRGAKLGARAVCAREGERKGERENRKAAEGSLQVGGGDYHNATGHGLGPEKQERKMESLGSRKRWECPDKGVGEISPSFSYEDREKNVEGEGSKPRRGGTTHPIRITKLEEGFKGKTNSRAAGKE